MVQVKVNEGVLEGEIVEGSLGGTFYSFKGIPYAKPPVGNLRFKAPQPPVPWDGIRNAKEHGPVCYQFNLFTGAIVEGSEDCLYLNVYSPNIDANSKLPVMFWIHGGAYRSGSGDSAFYGPDFLVKHNVILVTINYRLEVLGFLCLDSEDVPGNSGMKDQVAALRWVQKNISSFGGDPNNVTIFGESAGASSVSYHLISPMSKGLFKRAIIQSGSCISKRTRAVEPRQRAIVLAKQLGCDAEDPKELYDFFRNVSVKSLVKTNVPIMMAEEHHLQMHFHFGPVEEKKFSNNERFFYGDLFEQLNKGLDKDIEIMMGYTKDEGYVSFANKILPDVVNKFNKYLELFVPMSLAIDCPVSKQLEVGKKVKQFYYGSEKITENNITPLINFFSWCSFNFDLMQLSKYYVKKSSNKVYLYKFNCASERNIMSQLIGVKAKIADKSIVCHTDDLAYLFDIKVAHIPIDKQSKSYQMIQNTTTLWTNFAKYGNPTPPDSHVQWKPYTLETEDYLDIGETLVPRMSPDRKDLEFWESIYEETLPQYLAVRK